jgi:hypothetical protein
MKKIIIYTLIVSISSLPSRLFAQTSPLRPHQVKELYHSIRDSKEELRRVISMLGGKDEIGKLDEKIRALLRPNKNNPQQRYSDYFQEQINKARAQLTNDENFLSKMLAGTFTPEDVDVICPQTTCHGAIKESIKESLRRAQTCLSDKPESDQATCKKSLSELTDIAKKLRDNSQKQRDLLLDQRNLHNQLLGSEQALRNTLQDLVNRNETLILPVELMKLLSLTQFKNNDDVLDLRLLVTDTDELRREFEDLGDDAKKVMDFLTQHLKGDLDKTVIGNYVNQQIALALSQLCGSEKAQACFNKDASQIPNLIDATRSLREEVLEKLRTPSKEVNKQ